MKLSLTEQGMVLDALASHIESLEAFLSDASDFDDVDSVRVELGAMKELQAKITLSVKVGSGA